MKKIFTKFSILGFIFISFLLLDIKPALGTNLKLPFSAGEKWKITQGYEGSGWDDPSRPPTHATGSKDQYAIDFSLPGDKDLNKPILATADGTAYLRAQKVNGKLFGYGYYIDIDHGNGLISRHAHLLSYSINEGDFVKQGQEIGRCDNTGYKGGSHLHFAMYQKQSDGKLVAYKPEPMSGYGKGQIKGPFVANNWYVSDNELYKTKFVEEKNIPWWKKFLGAISGFFNNIVQPVVHFVAQSTNNNQPPTNNQQPVWQAEIISQSQKNLTLKNGELATFSVKIKNIGNQTWQPSNQVSINVFNQQARNIYHSSWRTRLRPAVINSEIAPGQTADFSFQIKAPNSAGNYSPSFQIVYTLNNSSFETLKSDLISWQIIVSEEKKQQQQQIVGSQPLEIIKPGLPENPENPTIRVPSSDNQKDQGGSSNGGGGGVSIPGGGGGGSGGGGGGSGGDGTGGSGGNKEEPSDTNPPETTITNLINLPQATNQLNITFRFSADEAATFECKLDAQSFQTCVSAKIYENLTEGSHQFQVRAIDLADNFDSTPAQFSWAIDFSGPIINLTFQPSSPTKETSAQFEFSSSEQVVFECSFDDSDWSVCVSPKLYGNLTDGAHLFSLRAKDEIGNYSQPIDAAWIIDSTPPILEITSKPDDLTNETSVAFKFSANETVIFSCKIDNSDWQECTSPQNYQDLVEGQHNFYLKAKDQVNLETEIFDQWQIDLTTPTSSITTNGIFNLASWPGKIDGTVAPVDDLAKVEIEIQRSSDSKYLNYATSTAEWLETETWLETAINLEDKTWQFEMPRQVFNDDIYKICSRAKDKAGNLEEPISESSFIFDATPPGKITNTNLQKEESNLIFSWSEVIDNLSGLDFYQVAWWIEGEDPNPIQTKDLSFTLASDEEKTYYFKVRAVDLAANQGEWSEIVSFQPLPYLESWQKRKIVIIDNRNNNQSLADFEIEVAVNYESEMNNDFSDIRFTDDDGQTLLNYGWDIDDEGLEKKENGVSAQAIVRVPFIPAQGQKKIYLYYGNPSAGSVADLEKTLTWFDHFVTNRKAEYNYRDINWETNQSRIQLSISDHSCGWIMPKKLEIKNLWLKARMARGSTGRNVETQLFWRYLNDANTWQANSGRPLANWGVYENGVWKKEGEGLRWSSSSYALWEVKSYNESHSLKIGEILSGSTINNAINQGGRIRIYDWWVISGLPRQLTMYTHVDYLYLRQYTEPMPNVSFK